MQPPIIVRNKTSKIMVVKTPDANVNHHASVAADFEPTNTATSSTENLILPLNKSNSPIKANFIDYLKSQGIQPVEYF